MTPSSLRFVCAGLGSLLLVLAASYVRFAGATRLVLLPTVLGTLMLVPAVFGERRDAVEEACLRFRNAAFACFGVAIALLTFILALHDRRGALAQQAASLGAACWLVAMLMTFCFAFYATKRRAATD
jgi:hypothetical protein